MLICTIMGEICLVAVQQKINRPVWVSPTAYDCIQQNKKVKGCSGCILKNDPFKTNK